MRCDIFLSACRVCLSDSYIMLNVFDEVTEYNAKLCDMIDECGDIKITETDEHSKLICEECAQELLISMKFREKCKKTKDILLALGSTIMDDEDSDNDISSQIDADSIKLPESVPKTIAEGNPINESVEMSASNLDSQVLVVDAAELICTNDDDAQDIAEINQTNVESIGNSIIDYVERVEKNNEAKEGNYPLEQILGTATDTTDSMDDDMKFEYEEILSDADCGVEENNSNSYENIEYLEIDKDVEYIVMEANSDDESVELEQQSESFNDEDANDDDYHIMTEDEYIPPKKKTKGIISLETAANINSPTQINHTCTICGAGFMHFVNLKRHLLTVHQLEESSINSCLFCSVVFLSFEEFESHLSTHGVNAAVKDLYPDLLKDSSNLERATADPRKNISCEQCKKKFISNSALKSHMRIHTGEKPYKCTLCIKQFTTLGGLDLHQRRHSGFKPYKCEYCERAFVESSNLKAHLRTHTGEKPHICTVCSKGFSRVFLLNIHQRTHTGEKPYACKVCTKSFAQQGDLSAHIRIHTGERPHICPLCQKGFIKSSGLQSHLKRHAKIINSKGPIATGSKVENELANCIIMDDNELRTKSAASVIEENIDNVEIPIIDVGDVSEDTKYIILDESSQFNDVCD